MPLNFHNRQRYVKGRGRRLNFGISATYTPCVLAESCKRSKHNSRSSLKNSTGNLFGEMANNYLTAAFKVQLRASVKIVLIALADKANKVTGECWPTMRTLEKMCGFSRPMVNKALRVLEERNLITINRERHYNRYKLNLVISHDMNLPFGKNLYEQR